MSMFVHDRHRAILERLARRPRWVMTQLQREMRVSRSTLRRDLLELERRGDVVRVHGGVVHRDYLQGEPTFDRKSRQAIAGKRAIAGAAVAQLAENAVAYIDAGTTCMEIGRRLMLRADVKIFTHSLKLAYDAAAGGMPASIVLVGGEVRPVSLAIVGGLALRWLEHLRFDIAFIAASGIDANGPSTTELSESAMKQAIIKQSARTILVADAGKCARPAAVRFTEWKDIDVWVVDSTVPDGIRDAAKKGGTQIVTAKQETE